MKKLITIICCCFLISACNTNQKENVSDDLAIQKEVSAFLKEYTDRYLTLYYDLSQAEWASNTHIVEGDTMNAYRTRQANEAYSSFVGSEAVIAKTSKFLEDKEKLEKLQVNQLEAILYQAANNPAIVEEIVKKRIKAETKQNELLFGFDFTIEGESVSTNEIDQILKSEKNLNTRLEAWRASKEVGKVLKDGLEELRSLRNATVRALGYDDYFTYQVSDYGMTTKEMMELNEKLIEEIWPLYRELHTYARYELAEQYGAEEIPDMIPAHWLPNRWGQDWSELVTVEGVNLDKVLEEKGNEWLVKQAERFYISLGFDSLPPVFYEKSSLYPLPENAGYKKNNHASAWHMDLKNDVRALMSVIPTAEWYETTHHELGHIYYYMSYTNPEVPPLLREGANRAFHEAVGSLMGLAAMQKPFLAHIGLVPESEISMASEAQNMESLLKEALNYVVFIPFSAGVMPGFEHDLYVDSLPKNEFNKRWWELKKKYQGIVPPTPRGEAYADAASKTHINNDAAQYYDYALSYVLLFQLHDHIARNILNTDPRSTNYYGKEEIGAFLKNILYPGATIDWRVLLKETTGEELNAKAMLNYFQPLMAYLKEQNKGRSYALPEKPA